MTIDGPDRLDLRVGSRIRLRRVLAGLTRGDLGEAVGLSVLQIQKYEEGVNRVSAATLWRIAEALDVSASYFFEDAQAEADAPPLGRHSLDLLRRYYRLPDPLRGDVLGLVKALGKGGPGA